MRNPSLASASGTRAMRGAGVNVNRPGGSKMGLRRGAWTAEEDEALSSFIRREGEGKWRTLPERAGLRRCGKSCRLRWMNYLRPSVKRGRITSDEEDLILRLHRLLGNRWALIAGRIPGRTDNEIKNYWNTHLSKKLINQGLDPRTHKPLSTIQFDKQFCSPPLEISHENGSHASDSELAGGRNPSPRLQHQLEASSSLFMYPDISAVDMTAAANSVVMQEDFHQFPHGFNANESIGAERHIVPDGTNSTTSPSIHAADGAASHEVDDIEVGCSGSDDVFPFFLGSLVEDELFQQLPPGKDGGSYHAAGDLDLEVPPSEFLISDAVFGDEDFWDSATVDPDAPGR